MVISLGQHYLENLWLATHILYYAYMHIRCNHRNENYFKIEAKCLLPCDFLVEIFHQGPLKSNYTIQQSEYIGPTANILVYSLG